MTSAYDPTDPSAARLEFEILARRASLDIPEERRDALFEEFLELKRLLAVLHGTPSPAEPASGFFIRRVIDSEGSSG